MKERIAIYAGSFDPLTNGHLDVLKASLAVADVVFAAIGIQAAKKPLFTFDERVALIDAVSAAFPDDADELLIEPDMASAGSFRASVNEERKHFDLWRANELVLRDIGLREDRVDVSRLCTACRTDMFYSHRAEKGNTGRFGGIVMLHEPVLDSRRR